MRFWTIIFVLHRCTQPFITSSTNSYRGETNTPPKSYLKQTLYFLNNYVDSFSQHFSTMIFPFLLLSRKNHWPRIIYWCHYLKRRCRDCSYYAQWWPSFVCQILLSQLSISTNWTTWAGSWMRTTTSLIPNPTTTRQKLIYSMYEWVIHQITCSLRSSQYSSPYHSDNMSSSYSSPQPLPIPPPLQQSPTPCIPIQTSPTITEVPQWQWRWDFLHEEFPEDPVEGSCENPIVIDVSDFEDWSGVSINVGEVLLQFLHLFTILFPLTHFITAYWYSFYPFTIQVLSFSLIHVPSLV